MKNKKWFVFVSLWTFCLTQCAPAIVTGEITTTGVSVTKTEIQFSGTSTLPNRACIETQLYKNDKAVEWWPATCANLHNGRWEMRVFLDIPLRALQPDATYTLRAWLRNTPAIVADPFVFDMTGPPTPVVNPEAAAMTLLLDAAALLAWEIADLDGDGLPEVVVLTGFGGAPDRPGYDFRELTVAEPDNGPDAIAGYSIMWRSGPLAGDRAEFLRVEDVNADGQPEIIVKHALGAAGETLQVFARIDDGYLPLRPKDGHFDARASFGETTAQLEDVDRDGIFEILAGYGSGLAKTDVYRWDGQAYTYAETRER